MKQEVCFCLFVALLVTLFHQGCSKTIKKGYETDVTGTERWKYVTVRPGAHMFYWFYETTAANPKNTPIIIWLQGGPGGSSTGFGNFGELGPLDVNLKPRPTTWLSAAHLLFIDNPVGTGFSYADTEDAFTTNVDQIAKDLLNVVSDFFKDSPELSSNPLFIFSESYGGKMTAAFSVVLDQAVKSGAVRCNFVGLAMGDSWISPLDYVLTWGPYLYVTSLVDETQLAAINKTGMECKAAYDAGEYKKATELWSQTETQCDKLTGGVNFYNILKWGESDTSLKSTVKRDPNTLYFGWPEDLKKEVAKEAEKQTPIDKLFARHVQPMLGDALADLMNGQIRKKLRIIPGNVTWGGQSSEVFAKQSGDFMKPVIDRVDHLLSSTDLQVVVYNGQLDLICDTLGTERWVQKLQWPHLEDYNQATRDVITGKDGNPVAYHKKYERFNFYWILDAGHMVPADQGESALTMVKMVIGSE